MRKGARVAGDIAVLGGTVSVGEGANVKGEVKAVGAAVSRNNATTQEPSDPSCTEKWLSGTFQHV